MFHMQLKYHDTGKEKVCLPQVGQWNMMNKVMTMLFSKIIFLYNIQDICSSIGNWPMYKLCTIEIFYCV